MRLILFRSIVQSLEVVKIKSDITQSNYWPFPCYVKYTYSVLYSTHMAVMYHRYSSGLKTVKWCIIFGLDVVLMRRRVC